MIQDREYSNHYIAEQGMYLTNSEGVFAKEIWIGKNDSIENWHEVFEEEVDNAGNYSDTSQEYSI